MTLVLTAATPFYVVQAADRLVSMAGRRGLRAADPAANKTIIYRAKDGVAVLSYAGLAYVDAKPTDEFLAELLWGEPLRRGPDGERPAQRQGRSPNQWSIGEAERALDAALAGALFQHHAIALTIAGWRMRKHRVVPFVTEIERSPNAKAPTISRAPRFFTPARNFFLHSIGVDISADEVMDGLVRETDGRRIGPSAEAMEAAAVRAIRARAAKDTRVGADVMSVVLPRPDVGRGRAVFHAARDWPAAVETSSRRMAVAHANHMPWIVAPHVIVPPSALVGEMIYDLGGYEIVLCGARGEKGVLGMQTSLARPGLDELRTVYGKETPSAR